MAKFDWRQLSKRDRKLITEELVAVIGAAPDKKALDQLLHNLLTPSEIIMIGRRILIAEALLEGKTYREIHNKLKLGMSTVLLVEKWLQSAQEKKLLSVPRRKKRFKLKDNFSYARSYPHTVGSVEHAMGSYMARFKLLGVLLDGLEYLFPPSEPDKTVIRKQKGKKKQAGWC